MSLIPVKLPPGLYRNGTPYSAKNRWVDGNLVRYHDGAIRPIGGWRRAQDGNGNDIAALYADPSIEAVRDTLQWRDNGGSLNTIFGTARAVYHLDSSGVVTDITPVGYTPGQKNATINTGYGSGPYGRGAYGVSRQAGLATITPPARWDFDTWGENLVACRTDIRGTIYERAPAGILEPIVGAPTDINGVAVTDERIVMAIGSLNEPRRVRWSAREDNTDWIADLADEAGGQTLQGSGALLSIDRVLGQMLILSETDAHIARFLGAPYVYGFDRIGDGCGPVHGASVVATDRFAMWLGSRDFWMYDGTLKRVPCDVMDFLRLDLNPDQIGKIQGFEIENFREIWWFYQSVGSQSEVDSYVMFDYIENQWFTGRLDRTAGVRPRVAGEHIYVSPGGLIYEHEIENLLVEGQAFIESGPLEIGNGDDNMSVGDIYPDSAFEGDMFFTLYGSEMPTAEEFTYGPYAYGNPTNTRAQGRQIRFRIDGLTNNWKAGHGMRLDVKSPQLSGKR